MTLKTTRPPQNNAFEWAFLEKTPVVFLVGLPVLTLIIAALPQMAKGYWQDEVFSIVASRSLSGLFAMFREFENNMSLFQVILYFWMQLFGESEVATHSLTLLAGIITIPVFFRLERMWLNKTSSFFGAWLLSVSPLLVNHTVDTRSYELLILSVTVSSLLYAKLMRSPGYLPAALYGVSVGAGTYLHYFGLLIAVVHFLTFTRKKITRRYLYPLLLAGLVAAVVISPLVFFPPRHKDQVNWNVAPDLHALWYVFSALFGGGYVVVLLAACGLMIFYTGSWKQGAVRGYEPEKLSAAWSFAPVLLMFFFSVYVKPIFAVRYFAWVTPGVALLIALVVAGSSRNTLVKTAIWFFILGLFVWKTVALYYIKGGGYKGPVAYLNAEVKKGETVLCYPYYWALDVNFYLDQMGSKLPDARPVSIAGAPYLAGGGGVDPDPDFDQVRKLARRGGRVYLLCDGNPGRSQGDSNMRRIWLPKIQEMLASQHPVFHEVMFEKQTPNPLRLVIYE